MTEIIPGILVHTLKELREKLHLLNWAKKVHIDIMDGKFVKNKTISLRTLNKVLPPMDIQVHLMAYKPHKHINSCANIGVREFVFHAEATKNAAETLEIAREYGMKAGIAFNPETIIEKHADTLVHADLALVMTVHPGFSGQTLMKKPLSKIAEIRALNPLLKIGVDGGINKNTCQLARKADFAIATHAITDAENPKKAYEEIKKRC
ncbi:MAG: hypothetical protein QW165_03020 [Candidatus Woesearchaeota archaeon]